MSQPIEKAWHDFWTNVMLPHLEQSQELDGASTFRTAFLSGAVSVWGILNSGLGPGEHTTPEEEKLMFDLHAELHGIVRELLCVGQAGTA